MYIIVGTMTKKRPAITTLYGISAGQILKLKQLALDILGKPSVSALVRAIAEGELIVKRKQNEGDYDQQKHK